MEVTARSASLAGARVGETFFAQHEAYLALCETKFALLTQKRRIWGVLRALGEFCHAQAGNKPSMAKKSRPKTPPQPYKVTIPQCRMQFDWEKFQQRLKTLEFQCY